MDRDYSPAAVVTVRLINGDDPRWYVAPSSNLPVFRRRALPSVRSRLGATPDFTTGRSDAATSVAGEPLPDLNPTDRSRKQSPVP